MKTVPRADAHQRRLDQLRRFRLRPEKDLSLQFMSAQFKREVARPFKQLQSIAGLWSQLVPPQLVAHTRLDGLSRGVLHVTVDSSAAMYELDRALRGGLQTMLIKQHRGPALRKIALRVGRIDDSRAARGGAASRGAS